MLKSNLTAIISIIGFFIILFFIWHFILSIYEVRFVYNFNPDKMLLDKVYKLECVAVNSLGWDLKFRDCKLSCKIEKGEGMIDILPNSENNILYFSLTGKGEIRILLNSKYSLNPTIISLNSR